MIEDTAALAARLGSALRPATVLVLGGSGSGKTRCAAQLLNYTKDLRGVAALAVTRGSVAALRTAIERTVFGLGREFSCEDLACLVGSVRHALFLGTADWAIVRAQKRDVRYSRKRFVNEYLRLIGLVATLDPVKDWIFLRGARTKIYAALRIGADLQLGVRDPNDLDLPVAPSFIAEVCERYAAFKAEFGFYDDTDLRLAGVEPNPTYKLVLIDDAEDLTALDYGLLRKLYPAASFVLIGNPEAKTQQYGVQLRQLPHELVYRLEGRSEPEIWSIESTWPQARLVPHANAAGGALVILGQYDRRHYRRWIGWCKAGGLSWCVDNDKTDATVRITTANRSKGRSAPTAIVDGFTFAGAGVARWDLAITRAQKLAVVLEHESNVKLRHPRHPAPTHQRDTAPSTGN